jgi:NAD(P)-dependent dehydrogenase (short-subunit alcohol dehydrogenase family)
MSAPSRIALVTGGGGVFGAAIARRLGNDGFIVVVTDAAVERAAAVCDTIPGSVPLHMDVTDDSSVTAAMAKVHDTLGGLDVVVNNAGIAPSGGMTTTALADFDRTMAINLRGAYVVSSAAMPHLLKSTAARVIMIGSRTWLSGGNPAYTASKAGVVGLCRTMAQELGETGGTCNVVAPGPVDTPFVDAMRLVGEREAIFARYARMTPMRRVAAPEDVANATAFFAGADASFITGEVLHVAGGLQLAPRL